MLMRKYGASSFKRPMTEEKEMNEVKEYAQRDLMAMDIAGDHYCRHVSAMTREQLHSKSDIAAELGWRDMQIFALKAERDALATENLALKAAIEKYAKVKQDFDDFDGDRQGIAACLCEAEDALVDGIKTPATDAYANQLRAEGVMLLHKEQKEVALKNWQYDNFDALKRAAIRHCDEELITLICMLDQMEGFAANLRKENGHG